MALTLLLVLSISTLTQVSIQSSSISLDQLAAEQAALFGLKQALGELQVAVGPDQRVTATSGIRNSAAGSGSSHHYTGVWKSETGMQASDRFVRWLVSEKSQTKNSPVHQETWVDTQKPIAYANQRYDSSDASYALMLGAGSVDASSSSIEGVVAEKVSIGLDSDSSAQFAWWIGDEGVKARINLVDPTTNASLHIHSHKLLSSQTQRHLSRNQLASLPGLETMDLQSGSIANKLQRISDLTMTPAGPTSQHVKSHFHNLTTDSYSILCDVVNGGLKEDLSLAFELSDAQFDSSVFGSAGPDTITAPGFGIVQPIFRLPNTTGVKANGPTWHLLRDYYTIYQRMQNPMSNPVFNAQAMVPNNKELNPGPKNHDWERLPALRYIADTANIVNAIGDGAQGDPLRSNDGYLPILVKANYVPNIQRHIISARVLFEDVNATDLWKSETDASGNVIMIPDPKYANLPTNYLNPNNYKFQKLRLFTQDHYVIHNPFNVALSHNGFASARDHLRFSMDIESPLDNQFDITGIPGGTNFNMLKIPGGTIAPGSLLIYSGVESNGNSFSSLGMAGAGNHGIEQPYHPTQFKIPVLPYYDDLDRENIGISIYAFNGNKLNNNGHWVFWQNTGIAVKGVDPAITNTLINTDVRCNLYLSNTSGIRAHNLYPDYSSWYDKSGSGLSDYQKFYTTAHDIGIDGQPYELFYFDTFLKPAGRSANNPYAYPGLTHTNPYAPIMQSRNLFPTSRSKPNYGWPMYGPNWQCSIYAPSFASFQSSGSNAFWGPSNSGSGKTNVTTTELPTSPLLSIGQLQHANVGLYAHMPAHAIGNSFASPYIARDKTYHIYNNRDGNERIFYDLSYLCNESLWDRYFFSSYSRSYDAANDAYNGTVESVFDQAFNNAHVPAGASLSHLPNPRMQLMRPHESLSDVRAKLFDSSSDNPLPTAYRRAAENLIVRGGFNVHSVSVDAWKTILSAAREQAIYPASGTSTLAVSDEHSPLSRIQLPTQGEFTSSKSSNDASAWGGFASLSDSQIEALANAIVEQIKLRVAEQGTAFTSLASFVNRSLSSSDSGLAGLLQAAIDTSGINSRFVSLDLTIDATHLASSAGDFPAQFSNNIMNGAGNARSTATTATAYLTQGDLLQAIGSFMTLRSDTFRIRSYGESKKSLKGQSKARRWCEAIVQRMAKPINPADLNPASEEHWQTAAGDQLGRQFKVISFRWLNADEI